MNDEAVSEIKIGNTLTKGFKANKGPKQGYC